eukprot:5687860-Amphidinium_carterae.1
MLYTPLPAVVLPPGAIAADSNFYLIDGDSVVADAPHGSLLSLADTLQTSSPVCSLRCLASCRPLNHATIGPSKFHGF